MTAKSYEEQEDAIRRRVLALLDGRAGEDHEVLIVQILSLCWVGVSQGRTFTPSNWLVWLGPLVRAAQRKMDPPVDPLILDAFNRLRDQLSLAHTALREHEWGLLRP